MQQKLGLNKFYKKETRDQKFKRWTVNQENGKRIHRDNLEAIKVAQNMTAEEKESAEIALQAQKIAVKKQISLIDAMDEAQLEYKLKKHKE